MKNKLKKYWIIILLLVTVLGAGAASVWYFYDFKGEVTAWSLISDDAILVYESGDAVGTLNHLLEQEMWSQLKSIPELSAIEEGVSWLDSLAGEGNLDAFFKNKAFYTSCHVTSKESFDFTFFLEVRNTKELNIFESSIQQLRKDPKIKWDEHQYQGYVLKELKEVGNDRVFTYLLYKNFIIASFTPFLVEDVIRTILSGYKQSFSRTFPGMDKLAKLQLDDGNLYVNQKDLNRLFNVFLRDDLHLETDKNPLAHSTFLDLQIKDNSIVMNGFTLASENDQEFLKIFRNQRPQAIQSKNYLPRRTSWFKHYSFHNAPALLQSLEKYWEGRENSPKLAWDTLKHRMDFDLEEFYTFLGREMSLAELESVLNEAPDRIFIAHLGQVEEARKSLDQLAARLSSMQGDTLYSEAYGGYDIKQLSLKEFPSLLLDSRLSGFDQSFYLIIDDYLIIGNAIQAVKEVVNDWVSENTWGRSVKPNSFVQDQLSKANYSLLVNTSRLWNQWLNQCRPDWKKWFEKYAYELRSYELLGVQYTAVDDKFYTGLTLSYEPRPLASRKGGKFDVEANFFADTTLHTKPFVVKNYQNNRQELFLQDVTGQVYLVSKEGEPRFKRNIDQLIQGEVKQLDFYKNGKWQYLFHTRDKLHLMDREGNHLPGFPLLPEGMENIQWLNLVDYDNSKNYRFFLADGENQLWLTDKNGKALEGWNPKKVDSELAFAPAHLRVRGRDYMLGVQKNGLIQVWNRRGQSMPGFPLDLKTDLQGPVFFEVGSSANATRIHLISRKGELIHFNLEGAVLYREQFYRPSSDSKFTLCPDALGRTYVVVRENLNRVSFMNRKGETLLEKDYITSDRLSPQFYSFESGKEIYLVTDHGQEFTYIYNSKGELVQFKPVESSSTVALMYFESNATYQLFKVFDKEYALLKFN